MVKCSGRVQAANTDVRQQRVKPRPTNDTTLDEQFIMHLSGSLHNCRKTQFNYALKDNKQYEQLPFFNE